MDSVVKVRRSFLNELRGFCRRFTSICDGCYRGTCDCQMADTIHIAKNLILRIDNIRDADEERFFIENPQREKFARVVKALEQAGKPVTANEIRVERGWGKYRRQKKFQLLSTMVRNNLIVMTETDGHRFYSLPQGTSQNTTTKDNNHGIQS